MKQITKNTILKQGDKIFQPVEVDGVVYWVTEKTTDITDGYFYHPKNVIFPVTEIYKRGPISSGLMNKIVAQSSPHLEGIPVISLGSYVENSVNLEFKEEFEIAQDVMPAIWYDLKLKIIKNYKSNPNQYTQKDIEKVIELSGLSGGYPYSKKEIFEKINSISVIEVDEFFCIKDYF